MKETLVINTYSKRKTHEKAKIRLSRFLSSVKPFDGNTTKHCLICGMEVKGFCKSHSLPKFVLRNISSDGNVKTGKTFQSDSHADYFGIKNAHVFRNICSECDGSYFQDYENEDAFYGKLTDTAINEIAIKNYLRYLYKQQFEKNKYEKLLNGPINIQEDKQFYENQLFLSKQNILDTGKIIRKYIKQKNKHNYYVIDEIDLDYKTELAFQGFITLVYGFDGLINDIYDYSLKTKMQQLGICVFPHKRGTKILLFCEEGLTKLKHFYKSYKKLTLDEKLYVINYILLLYDEEWVVDSKFDGKLNKETRKLINQHDTVLQMSNNPFEIVSSRDLVNSVKDTFTLYTKGNIYNFLSKQ